MLNSIKVKKNTIERDEKSLFPINDNISEWLQICETLKTQRIKYHLTQKQIAKGIGVSCITIRRLEKGVPVNNAKILLISAYMHVIMLEIACSRLKDVLEMIHKDLENS